MSMMRGVECVIFLLAMLSWCSKGWSYGYYMLFCEGFDGWLGKGAGLGGNLVRVSWNG